MNRFQSGVLIEAAGGSCYVLTSQHILKKHLNKEAAAKSKEQPDNKIEELLGKPFSELGAKGKASFSFGAKGEVIRGQIVGGGRSRLAVGIETELGVYAGRPWSRLYVNQIGPQRT
ncbi:MAG: hypothetical protein IPK04_01310 [Bdellovibrionales bacterium]|nr:hypothetical protein [Bdellovibrionales bacterium]